MQKGLRRVLFDISYTLSSEKMSGVERVVTNLNRQLSDICSERGIEFLPVISVRGKFYRVTLETTTSFERFVNWKKSPWEHTSNRFRSVANATCRVFPHRKVVRALQPQKGHLGIFRLPAEIWERRLRYKAQKSEFLADATVGDLVLMPDAYWTEMQALRAGNAAKANGAFVVAIAYDLIPLTHPKFVGESRSSDFREYFRQLMKSTSGIVAISKTVEKEIRDGTDKFLRPYYGDEDSVYTKKISSFRLGCDFSKEASSLSRKSSTHPILKAAFPHHRTHPVHLMVSTFDPRKNHAFVLDAFEKAWSKGSKSSLCFIGRMGWLCDDILDRLNNHPEKGKRLFVVHDATDTDVQFAYQQSSVSILPSVTEGFGLPIVESLLCGIPTWASDIPIHREVGQEHCDYFCLNDNDSLAKKVLDFEKQFSSDAKSANGIIPLTLTSWRESAEQLLEVAGNLNDAPERTSPNAGIAVA
ncbi:glycosyltransferase [Pirellulaceae bacterium SH449]